LESGRQDARARCAWAGQEDSWWTARLRSICALERWRMQEMLVVDAMKISESWLRFGG